MSFVNAKCTNCGANITVDNTLDAFICSYCGSAFVVEKAINNYQITNNIQSDIVNIYNMADESFHICGGVLQRYNSASLDPVIPNNVIRIGDGVFENTLICSVTIPSTVQEIGSAAFKNCKRLHSIKVPEGVETIGAYAFYGAEIEKIELPDGIKTIGKSAFNNCKKLHSITIPKSVETIEAYAFYNTEIEEIELPSGIKTIGNSAFEKCTKIKSVCIPNTIVYLGERSFADCTSLADVSVSYALPLNYDEYRECFSNTPALPKILNNYSRNHR